LSETRKIAAILVADVFGYSRLTGVDEKERWRGYGRCAAIWLIPRSPQTMGASSSAPATEASSSFAASSTLCDAQSRCRTA
jgi:hypothetical protein